MSIAQLLPVLKGVLTNKIIIICAIVVFLYVDFVWFVARYRKKPRPVKAKKSVASPPAPPAENAAAPNEANEAKSGA